MMISIYDSHCATCNAFRRWIARRDLPGKICFIDNQSDESINFLSDLPAEVRGGTLFFIDHDGHRYRGVRAIFLIISHTEGLLGFMCKLLAAWPTYMVFEPVYRLFARHRGKFAWLLRK